MERTALINSLADYRSEFPTELEYVPRFLSLLRNFPNCYERSLLSGHMTASAWILDEEGNSTALVHHKKLNRWLQPGGHADGEEDILEVAQKEASEETGLTSIRTFNADIFDIDIHLIPSHKHVHSHYHFDIRFLFIADKNEEFVISDESNELSWVKLSSISDLVGGGESIVRMVRKSNLIFK